MKIKVKESVKRINTTFALVAIIVLGTLLRVCTLGSKSIWCDEALSIGIAESSFMQVVTNYFRSIHPPFYYLLLHFWVPLGQSEFAIRFLSVIFGVLSILLIYKVGKILFSTEVGLTSALLLAISPFGIWYSQTARMHILLAFLSLLSIYLFIKILEENKALFWPAFVLVNILNIYTHYFAFFIIAVENLYLIFLWKEHRHLTKRWLVSQFAILLSFLPWLSMIASQVGSVRAESLPEIGLPLLALSPFYLFALGQLLPVNPNLAIILPAILIFGGIFSLGLLSIKKAKNSMLLLFLYLFLPILLMVGLSLRTPKLGTPRGLLLVLPAFCLILAKGIHCFRKPKLVLLLLALVVIISVASLQDYYRNDINHGLKASARHIQENYREGDIIVHTAGESFLPYGYYFSNTRDQYVFYPPVTFASAREDELNVTVPNRFGEIVKERVVEKIWIVCYENISTRERVARHGLEDFPGIEIAPPNALTTMLVSHNFRLSEEKSFSGRNPTKILLYVRV